MAGDAVQWWRYPTYALGVLGSEKSFRGNPVIGSPRLNRMGLHRERVRLAARLCDQRRRMLASSVEPHEREAFDRDGFVIRKNALPQDIFDRLRAALEVTSLPAREMRQGQTVTRMIPLGPAVLNQLPDLASFARNPSIASLVRYVGGAGGDPVHFIQTVIAEPELKKADPQTALHADTFHSTSKAWLFLQDVGPDDGPFVFVPGSHKLTDERLEWEFKQSLTAIEDKRSHHAAGSFRISPDELRQLGDFEPQKVVVEANTLVVADTYAFHSRAISDRHTIRAELHAYHRANPFSPFPFSPLSLVPGLSERQLDLFLRFADRKAQRTGKRPVWSDVGECTVFSGPHI